jgi:hypothetical protein
MDQDHILALIRNFDVLEARTKILMDICGAAHAQLEGPHYAKMLFLERLKELSPLPAAGANCPVNRKSTATAPVMPSVPSR